MSFLGTKSDARKNIQEVEPYNSTSDTSPAFAGMDKPGPANKLSGETMNMQRTTPKLGHAGDAILRSKGE